MNSITDTAILAAAQLSPAGRAFWMAVGFVVTAAGVTCFALQSHRDGTFAMIASLLSAVGLMVGGLLMACALTGRPPGGPTYEPSAAQTADRLEPFPAGTAETTDIARRAPVGGDSHISPARRTQQ